MGDFNPTFAFESGSHDHAAEAPWELAGALSQAPQQFGTSVDAKIERQVAERNAIRARQKQREQLMAENRRKAAAGGAALGRAPPVGRGEEGDSGSGSDGGGSEDSEDRPLPGEEDDSSDEGEEEAEPSDQGRSRRPAARPAAVVAKATSAAAKRARPSQPATTPMDEELVEEEQMEEGEDSDEGHGAQAKRRRGPSAPRRGGLFEAAPAGTSFAAQSFSDLNLSRPLVRACAALGYSTPTPIQAACVPLALTGRDISGSAVTGSGKTAAFALPLLERLLHRNRRLAATYVLVLAPTRELAVQVHSMIQKLAQFTDVRAALVVGGLSVAAQAAALREAPEVVVATPGRLIDHLRNSQGFGLEDLACLVLDEADRLLEMGFADEVSEILRLAPAKRQTLLFSATMTDEVRALAALSLRHPVRLAADAAAAAPAALTQEVVRLKGGAAAGKEAALLALAARSLAPAGARAIVFFRTKQRAHRARIVFGLAGLPPAAELHGDMSQAARLEALERFRRGEASFLLATDVAARGLDILGVDTVVNYDCPRTLEAYLHRVGRTARAGGRGRSVTFVEDGDRGLLRDVVRRARAALTRRALPAAAVAGWQARVEALEPEVARVVGEEAEERALRRAEMEAQKASNMVEHEAEIAARPARTWFQSGTQKRDSAARAKEAAAAEGAAAAGEAKGKDKSAKRQERKAAAAKEAAEAARQKGRGKLMEETAAVTGKVRAAKVRAQALQREGMPASLAGRMAAAQAAGVKKKQRKASAAANGGKKAVGADDAGGGLFSGDGVTRGGPESAAVLSGRGAGTQVYAGGARSGVPKKPPSAAALSGSALSKAKRAGKGRHSFKSKGRHNRRKK